MNPFELGLLGDDRSANGPALIDPDLGSISHGELDDLVARLAGQLVSAGGADVDAIVWALPNGVATSILYLAALRIGTAAPLNPRLTASEFEARVGALGDVLVVSDSSCSDLDKLASPDGLVMLGGSPLAPDLKTTTAESLAVAAIDSVAPGSMVLLTSGTTGDPKRVRLTPDRLVAAADQVCSSLELTDRDRCLAIMPQFHIHGLQATLLAPLRAGGSVVVPTRFDPFSIARLIESQQATWFSAVPTMQQAILSRSGATAQKWGASLRCLRTSSSALSPSLHAALEEAYGIPVVEAYGMTECAHQIASNRLGDRTPGSVGFATGVEIRIDVSATEAAEPSSSDPVIGDVMVRGASVIDSYDGGTPFADGWFPTGDEGWLDAEGRLTLTGRTREIINRAGEKVRPIEVEQVLEQHPAVSNVAVFGVPDERLGESVGAVVVLDEAVTEAELRVFARTELAKFKVPSSVVTVDVIPTGPTGKVQRRRLASQLGLAP